MIHDQSFGIIPFRLIQGEKEFLVVHHKKGHWGIPKGHPEKSDENKFFTAKRELAEEVGLTKLRFFKNISFFEKYQFEESGREVSKVVEYFLAEIDPEQDLKIQKEELFTAQWLPGKQAINQLTFSASKKVLQEAIAWLEEK